MARISVDGTWLQNHGSQAGVPGPSVARDYSMTHQNVCYISKTNGSLAACPRGEGTACKAGYAGSNPVAASMRHGFNSAPRLQRPEANRNEAASS